MDPFALLRQGTVFNKKRFGADISAFKVLVMVILN